jgi:hypothetical protein
MRVLELDNRREVLDGRWEDDGGDGRTMGTEMVIVM